MKKVLLLLILCAGNAALGSFPFCFWSSGGGASVGGRVSLPQLAPDNSCSSSVNVAISCVTSSAHLFYTLNGATPTHSGDTATGATVRIGSNSGTVNTGSGSKTLNVIGYDPSLSDSAIASGDYGPVNCL